jgi:UDP-N-acetyl-alpha-D-muramoyl-L-alanyl-L-glutamate epimerase
MAYDAFVFEAYRWQNESGTLSLRYRYPDGPHFEETIVFDFPRRKLGEDEAQAVDRLFRLLLLFAGVSYYKAFIPPLLTCDAFPLDAETARFVADFYQKGLGEFAFANRVSLAFHIRLSAGATAAPAPLRLGLPRRSLVPVGGGKDSIVTIETLKRGGENATLFALGDAAPIAATIDASGLPSIRVTRRLDPALFALNRAGALNGHVPITGILSAIALAAAVLHGSDTVVMSNEHSASAPNLVLDDGGEINHQYSKSFEFETGLARWVARHVSPDLVYFSLLRPLGEIAIGREFARHPRYFDVFRSCNTAFRQDRAARGTNWCGACPKCRFVFLALAPFVARRELIRIFGRDLLDDPGQIDGYAALCGLVGHKPFECVGETAESATVIARLADDPQWRDAAVLRALKPRLPAPSAAADAHLFDLRQPHLVPARYLKMLDASG